MSIAPVFYSKAQVLKT